MSNSGSTLQHSINPPFQFINFTNPENPEDLPTRKFIRQQAMRNVGMARRLPRKKRGITEFSLDNSLLESITALQNPLPEPNISPYQLLGGGEIDPFISYPIPLDHSARELVTNVFRNGILRAHRDDWFVVGLSDPLPFHLILSNSALGLEYLRSKNRDLGNVPGEGQQALTHYGFALRNMSERLKNRMFQESDAAIGGAVGFMCHDIVGDQLESWLHHREGLKTLLSLRGGIDTIHVNKQLRAAVSWVEIRGAYVYDQRPNFPMPSSTWNYDLITAQQEDRPSAKNEVVAALRRHTEYSSTCADIYSDLIDFSVETEMLLDQRGPAFWMVRTDGGGWTNMMITRLLSWRPLLEAADDEYVGPSTQEVCRLAELLYIASIWRKFGASPVVTAALVKKLITQLQLAPKDWGELWPLRVWVLAIGSLEAEDNHDFPQVSEMFVSQLRDRQILSWNQIFPSIKAVLWMENVLDGADDRLGGEIGTRLGLNLR